MKTAAITERRWAVETGGITLNGAAIATDRGTSQAKLSGALQLVQDDDTAFSIGRASTAGSV
jgi:hypothetical protein